MIFGKGYFHEVKDDLVIENYPNLEKIVVKNSLQNIISLKICNNDKLKTIVIEDGENWEEKGERRVNGAFYYVKNVIIESTTNINSKISKSS